MCACVSVPPLYSDNCSSSSLSLFLLDGRRALWRDENKTILISPAKSRSYRKKRGVGGTGETSSVEETTDRNLCCHCQTLLLFLLHTHAHRHILLSEWNLLDRHIFTTTHISFNVKYTPIFFHSEHYFPDKKSDYQSQLFLPIFQLSILPEIYRAVSTCFRVFLRQTGKTRDGERKP